VFCFPRPNYASGCASRFIGLRSACGLVSPNHVHDNVGNESLSLFGRLDPERLSLSSPSPFQPMIIADWELTDPNVVRQRLQDRYDEMLKIRRGGF
jgi:hypothetical protein